MPDFKTRLKRLRKQRGLTQQEVGETIGVSKVAVSGYEKGTRFPETVTLKKMATMFGTSIDYLVGYSDIPNRAADMNNSNYAHVVSDISLVQKNATLIIDNELVDEELLIEMLDYVRARRLMNKMKEKTL